MMASVAATADGPIAAARPRRFRFMDRKSLLPAAALSAAVADPVHGVRRPADGGRDDLLVLRLDRLRPDHRFRRLQELRRRADAPELGHGGPQQPPRRRGLADHPAAACDVVRHRAVGARHQHQHPADHLLSALHAGRSRGRPHLEVRLRRRLWPAPDHRQLVRHRHAVRSRGQDVGACRPSWW